MSLFRDRRGAASPAKLAAWALLALPVVELALILVGPGLGPRPVNDLIHLSGEWTLRLWWLSLAVTPVRRLWAWPQALDGRRYLGVGTAVYAALHFTLFFWQSAEPWVAVKEIFSRPYLTIGFLALLALAMLAATSRDVVVRRMGGMRWRKLHWLTWPAAMLALAHHFWQAKQDISHPTVMAGLLLALILWRWQPVMRLKPVVAAGLVTLLASLIIVAGEMLWYGLAKGVPVMAVIGSYGSFDAGLRPAYTVLIVGTMVTAGAFWRQRADLMGRARP